MTPLSRFLEAYLGPTLSMLALVLVYATLILASCMCLGRLSLDPMFYLDVQKNDGGSASL